MRSLVEALCSDDCAGRAAGTPGGALARRYVRDAMRAAGLDPEEQPVPEARGANVLARIPGDIDRWVLVAAHYDHLGTTSGGAIYRGADDNAASVAVLIETATRLARARPDGRGVIVAAFDAEEPPYFSTSAMGSEHFARHPIVPLDRIDMMVCMELVGHDLGPEGLPEGVRETLFALGAERSEGTSALVDTLATSVDGVVVRPADAEVIPPLSDHAAFWAREIPFLLLTGGRTRHYHTPTDRPETLSIPRMASVARWLERFVRANCSRDRGPVAFRPGARDDASTLRSFLGVTGLVREHSTAAAAGYDAATALLAACGPDGALPEALRPQSALLVAGLEEAFA